MLPNQVVLFSFGRSYEYRCQHSRLSRARQQIEVWSRLKRSLLHRVIRAEGRACLGDSVSLRSNLVGWKSIKAVFYYLKVSHGVIPSSVRRSVVERIPVATVLHLSSIDRTLVFETEGKLKDLAALDAVVMIRQGQPC